MNQLDNPREGRFLRRPERVARSGRRRASAVGLRWIDIFSYALVAAALLIAGHAFFAAIANWVGHLAFLLPARTTLVGLFTLTVLATYPLVRAAGFSPRRLAVQLFYPSLWVAAIIAFVLLDKVGTKMLPGERIFRVAGWDGWAAVAVLVAGYLAAVLASHIIRSLRRNVRSDEMKRAFTPKVSSLKSEREVVTPGALSWLFDNQTILVRWIEENSPIDSPERDFFGFTSIAERVARRLRGVRLNTFAFTGPYGCGKTSLRLLVEQNLKSGRVRTCNVDGWGLDEQSAPEKILRSILATIARDVDCTRLMFLPARYSEAIKAASSGPFKPIAEIIAVRDPAAVLEELDEVLLAANLQVVVFVEDLDRNATPDILAHVGGLLDRLRHLCSVSFVVSLDPARAGSIDLLRLCDYIEPIPPLRSDEVAQILVAFQSYCQSLFPGDYDFVSDDERKRWSTPVEDLIFGVRKSKVTEVLVRALDTPRKLNHALRQTYFLWDSLHGEVEFQALLVAMALRVAAPEAWAFICANTDRIRALSPSSSERVMLGTKGSEERIAARKAQLVTEFERASAGKAWESGVALELIGCLFPSWQDGSPRLLNTPQSLEETKPTDYWRRIITETIVGPRDQEFLRGLFAWRSNAPGGRSFVARFYNDDAWTAKLEQLKSLVSPGEVLRLASEFTDQVLDSKGVGADMGMQQELLAVWRMSDRQKREQERFLRGKIREVLPRSLQLALSLEYYWASTKTGHMTPDRAVRIRQFVRALVRRTMKTADALVNALDPDHPWTINHLIRHEHLQLAHISEWRWFAPMLLAALEADDTVMVPQVAMLLVKSDDPTDVRDGSFLRAHHLDREFANAIFPASADWEKLARLLSNEVDLRKFNADTRDAILAVQNAFRAMGAHP